MSDLVIILVMFFYIAGPAFVIGAVGLASIRELGSNPAAAAKIFLFMIVALIFAESIAIIALLIIFPLFGK